MFLKSDTPQRNLFFTSFAMKISFYEFRKNIANLFQKFPESLYDFAELRKLPLCVVEKISKGLRNNASLEDYEDSRRAFDQVTEDFYNYLKYELKMIE